MTDEAGSTQAELVRFVRETLGCACPEEVLARIEVRETPEAEGVPEVVGVLEVGGRLLVWLVDAVAPAELASRLAAVVEAGRTERDRRGFNRLRVVVPLRGGESWDPPPGVLGDGPGDDRVHLHTIDPTLIPRLCRGGRRA